MPIKIDHLTHIYEDGSAVQKKALDDICLEIEDGEFVGIIGHTGSGKSTLIQHLNALLVPTSGHVYLNGEDIYADKSKLKSIRQRVGLVFQYPEHQLFEMTVYKDVAYGPGNLGLCEEDIDIRVRSALETVGLGEDIFEKSPFELSGGQRRRAAIAGILAMEPEVLILDEPTAGLDPKGRDEILESIKKMHEIRKVTVILVSHSMEDVAKLAEKIIVLSKGKVAVTGTPDEVFSQVDKLESIGLAAPQIHYVFTELKKLGYDISEDTYTVGDATEKLYKFLKRVE